MPVAAKPYAVKVLPAAQRDLDDLDPGILRRVVPHLTALRDHPRPHGAIKLTGDEGYRLRVGSYRILYRIDDHACIVFIYRIKHRKEAYR